MEDDKSICIGNEGYLNEFPREMQRVIKGLVIRHGGGRLAHEAKGMHLYIPCPKCLDEKGAPELDSMHMTINVDKYFSRGQYKNQKENANKWSAWCHRKGNKHMFGVPELLTYKPVDDRGYKAIGKLTVAVQDTSTFIEHEESGVLIPRLPGKCIPITALPQDHPAVEYLVNRKYDLKKLYDHLRCSFCISEWPEDSGSEGVKPWRYRKMPGGWKDTPQGRLIFFIDSFGIPKGWQARILDKVEGDRKYHWHPYSNVWQLTHKLIDDKWTLRADWRGDWKWSPSKYRTAKGCAKSRVLMGLDAALKWNKLKKLKRSIIFLVEGPLDAARIGPPACAILGKSLSAEQAKLLRSFKHVVLVLDNDDAGRSGVQRAMNILKQANVDYSICEIPAGYNDTGEMPDAAVENMIAPYIENCL